MGLDIRVPIGALFTLLGLLLVVYGCAADVTLGERTLGLNLNLAWGAVMTTFGAAVLALARASRRRAADSAQPRAASSDETQA